LNNVLIAFLLTLFAGLSTSVGSTISFLCKTTNKKFLSAALGFSAGVMIYVSLVEIFPEALSFIENEVFGVKAYWITTIAFFAGMALITIIDKFVPSAINPHELKDLENGLCTLEEKQEIERNILMRTGLFSALAVAIHNFPEGIATFTSALIDPALGLTVAIAVAIHNIPEGIAVSVPIFYATKSKRKAFFYSALSGMTEPLGAIVAYFLLRNILTDTLLGILFASVAGIMVFISFDELLPTAEKYGNHHIASYGVFGGMLFMAFSLLLLA